MGRKNRNADYFHPTPKWLPAHRAFSSRWSALRAGSQPGGRDIDSLIPSPHQNPVGNGLKPSPTPETIAVAIVHDHRKSEPRIQEIVRIRPSHIMERIIKIFLWLAIGWGIGYLHHFLVTPR